MNRCKHCGIDNRTGAKFCSHCGKPLPQPTIKAQQQSPVLPAQPIVRQKQPSQIGLPAQSGQTPPIISPQAQQQPVIKGKIGNQILNATQRIKNYITKTRFSTKNIPFKRSPHLIGTVINMDPVYDEAADFDFARLVCKLLIVAIILYALRNFLGVFLFLVFIFLLVFRISWFIILSLVKKTKKEERVPVRNFRVKDSKGNEYQVKIKGQLTTGNVSVGDNLSIWGRWKSGNLHFKKAYNHRTLSKVQIKRSPYGIILLLIIVLVIISELYYYLSNY